MSNEKTPTVEQPKGETLCENCRGDGSNPTGKIYPGGHREVYARCETCNGKGFIPNSPGKPVS